MRITRIDSVPNHTSKSQNRKSRWRRNAWDSKSPQGGQRKGHSCPVWKVPGRHSSHSIFSGFVRKLPGAHGRGVTVMFARWSARPPKTPRRPSVTSTPMQRNALAARKTTSMLKTRDTLGSTQKVPSPLLRTVILTSLSPSIPGWKT